MFKKKTDIKATLI